MQNIDYRSRAFSSTALVIANTRHIKDYQIVQDMLKTEKGAWGNHITYYHVSVPKLQDIPISNPLQFVRKAHTSIKRNKNSFANPLITKLLRMKNKLEGPEVSYKWQIKTSLQLYYCFGTWEKKLMKTNREI